ncbi:hypothetical protein E1B28_010249 [Marasmius oreades]|uniref:Uncharacterized protein n=1 Tax=Marasmius oreades TaxID=181124 RepID=A0A9P7RY73_9AGAR|nr:uncharacterized protein E1B28_010249 [Marasmius oreades]KAG7091198.1 hypothetical protein E1B28_010249 [Marasmius oreades]
MVAILDPEASSLYHFSPPKLRLSLAIGRKRNKWYLIFAKSYPTADCREVARLNAAELPVHGHRFWFDHKATTGWEPSDKNLLEYLSSLGAKQPDILSIVSSKGTKSEPSEVVVLIPEHRLARWCERCHSWESIDDPIEARYIISRKEPFPAYLCPPCYESEWCGFRTLRNLFNAVL